jgi:hypothetical protein
MYLIAKKNLEYAENDKQNLERTATETRVKFKDAVAKAVSEGKLPQSALGNLHRIDSVKIIYHDFLKHPNLIPMGTNSPREISIRSNIISEPSLLENTLIHEFVHEISGQAIRAQEKVTTFPDGQILTDNSIHRRKTGVAVSGANIWINEAITESISQMLCDYIPSAKMNDDGTYPKEREKLKDLINKDPLLQKEAFEAYFENIITDQLPEKSGEFFKKLVDRVNAIEGPFGWTKIKNGFELTDNVIPTLGIPMTKNPDSAKKYIGRHKVYKVQLKYGNNEKGMASETYYIVSQSGNYKDKLQSAADAWKWTSKDGSKSKYIFSFDDPEEVTVI